MIGGARLVEGTTSVVSSVSCHHRGYGQETRALAYLCRQDAEMERQRLVFENPRNGKRRISLSYIAVQLDTVTSIRLPFKTEWSDVWQNFAK